MPVDNIPTQMYTLIRKLMVLNAVGLAVHIIVTAQAAVERGSSDRHFLAWLF